MLTVADCIRKAVKLQKISESPRLDVELILCAVMNKSRTWIYTWPEAEVSPLQASEFSLRLNRRIKGEPVAHILGVKEFWSLPLQVNASTLIPRPDTELLVETALELNIPKHNILDLGTGTGAIALALAKELPESHVTAVDCVPAAVQLAKANCEQLHLKNVDVFESDWFSAVVETAFNLIVSNPPYIDAEDVHLTRGDVVYEPRSALVAKEQGLADLRHIIEQSRHRLCAQGVLLVEHGWQQGASVQKLFCDCGYHRVETRQDIADRDRVTFGFFEP